MLLEQGAALTFGHSAPDAELHTIIEGVRSTFGDHRTVPADHRGFALGSAADKQLVGIGRSAQCLRDPGYPGFPVDPWK
jgi:hypothetical protein